jgi:hypothetical protein
MPKRRRPPSRPTPIRRPKHLATNMVILPDGQTQVVEAETMVARDRAFLLLDDTGADIREIPIIDAPSRPQ